MLVAQLQVRLVAEIQKSTKRLVQKQGSLLEDVLVLRGEVEKARCRWGEHVWQRTLVQYIPVVGRHGYCVEDSRRGIRQAMEHRLARGGVLVAVSPPFPDIGILDKHRQFTAHLANEEES
jgi:hypothetical protein